MLLNGEVIHKKINESIVYSDVEKDTNSIWSFLIFNGYLKVVEQIRNKDGVKCKLGISNNEVSSLYKDIILNWFSENINNDRFNMMLNSLMAGDTDVFGEILGYFVQMFSCYDVSRSKKCKSQVYEEMEEAEKVYHAFVLGLLVALENKYQVISNGESGYVRYDVMLIPQDRSKLGIIFEFKVVSVRKKETLEIAVDKALEQIKQKNYKKNLVDLGIHKIIEVGIAFFKRDILVKSRNIFEQ